MKPKKLFCYYLSQVRKILAYRGAVFSNEAKEVEESHDVIVFAVGDDRDQRHDVVLDRVGVDGVDLRQHASQRVVTGYDGVDDRLKIKNKLNRHSKFDAGQFEIVKKIHMF
jgi:hypothetical protein